MPRIHAIRQSSDLCFALCTSRFKSSATCASFANHIKPGTLSFKFLLIDHLENQRLDQARSVFDRIPNPDASLYTMMISGYTKSSKLHDALKLFDQMPVRDLVSWNSMIKGCIECGDLVTATKLFDEMPDRNVISWTTMVSGYFQSGKIDMAERFFHQMPTRDVAAWNSMIHGYLQFGRVETAVKLFEEMPQRNVISWTSVIGGLDQNGKSEEALSIFDNMLDSGVEFTSRTFACTLTACANVTNFLLGLQMHGCVVKNGLCSDEYVSSSLITFYSNCKQIEDSCKVFDEKLAKNVVIWTALLTGYGSNCRHKDALKVFSSMMKTSVLPNQSTFTSVLNSCSALESLDTGKEVHGLVLKLGLQTDVFVGNSLVVMYSGCGNVNDAVAAFMKISGKNIVSWNSAIVGCAQHGYGLWALAIFGQMVRANVEPDEITFTGLLSACSHSGMLLKGRHFFDYMSQSEAIEVKLQHYACIVDILGRHGKLHEAEELIKGMPVEANSTVWLAFLGACKMHSDLDRAEKAAEFVFDLDPNSSAGYVLLSNLYASVGKWTEVSRMRGKMRQRGITKQPGKSWVILKGQKHEFRSGDKSHPLSEKIYQKLNWLSRKLKDLNYVPDQRFALHDVEEEQKEEMLAYHSERLAIAFGLISTVEGSPITVMKNLRICGDCHSAIKVIAKIVKREIVVRDSSRFHHFKDGNCSCGDYW